MKYSIACLTFVCLVGCEPESASQPQIVDPSSAAENLPKEEAVPSAEVAAVRLIAFKLPSGERTQKVMVNIKNTGTTVIRAVDADLIPYNHSGGRLTNGVSNYSIYAVSDSSPGIAPGETYIATKDEGFILPPSPVKVKKVEVRITKVLVRGAF